MLIANVAYLFYRGVITQVHEGGRSKGIDTVVGGNDPQKGALTGQKVNIHTYIRTLD